MSLIVWVIRMYLAITCTLEVLNGGSTLISCHLFVKFERAKMIPKDQEPSGEAVNNRNGRTRKFSF